MRRVIFYSWQSDLPNSTNRGFIQDALEKAASSISADKIDIDPVIDRDTQGVSGSPDIAATIFKKISTTDIFVADVSIINKDDESRSTPNPNVLIELGYALNAIGHERVILVFNKAYGRIENLPFDLKMRRIVVYDSTNKEEKLREKKNLENTLKKAIITGIKDIPIPSVNLSAPSIDAIEDAKPKKINLLRKDLKDIYNDLVKLEPKKPREGGTMAELMDSLDKTKEIVARFLGISQVIAGMKDNDCALEICRWLGNILENYDLPEGFQGQHYYADEDYFKFIGHELFVGFISLLLHENQWEIIKAVLGEPIPLKYIRHEGGPGYMKWDYASAYLSSFEQENKERQRISVHSDILHERYKSGPLSEIISSEDFTAADFFLYLASKFQRKEEERGWWYPFSIVHMKYTPWFIKLASKDNVAKQIIRVFKLSNVNDFKVRMEEIYPTLNSLVGRGHWRNPIRKSDIENIGTD